MQRHPGPTVAGARVGRTDACCVYSTLPSQAESAVRCAIERVLNWRWSQAVGEGMVDRQDVQLCQWVQVRACQAAVGY